MRAGKVHEDGQVIGSYRELRQDSPTLPFHWSESGGFLAIPLLPELTRGDHSPSGVSAKGQVVGDSPSADTLPRSLPYVWSSDAGTRRLPGDYESGVVKAINDAGVIVGAVRQTGSSGQEAVYWPNAEADPVFIARGAFEGATIVDAINLAGRMAGSTGWGPRFFLWTESEGFQLVPAGESLMPWISGVTETGHVYGGFYYRPPQQHPEPHAIPFLLTAEGVLYEMPLELTPNSSLSPIAASDDGALVCAAPLGSPPKPFYWTAQGGVQDILGDAGWRGRAEAISPNGVVGGNYSTEVGVPESTFLWSPDSGFVDLNSRQDEANALPLSKIIQITRTGLVLAQTANQTLALLRPLD